jgi:hypothetical protein
MWHTRGYHLLLELVAVYIIGSRQPILWRRLYSKRVTLRGTPHSPQSSLHSSLVCRGYVTEKEKQTQ